MKLYGRGINADFAATNTPLLDYFRADDETPDFYRCTKVKLGRSDRRSKRISDADFLSIVPYLRRSTVFATLDLSGTDVSDVSVEALSDLQFLSDLDLSNTKISNTSLPALCKMQSLSSLKIYETSFSIEELESLGRLLPNCKVEFAQSADGFGVAP